MANVVYVPEDPRFKVLNEGVAKGTSNYFEERRKQRLGKIFDKSFDKINAAPSYEAAVTALADVDPAILTDPAAMEMLSKQIAMRFPEQETLEVFNAEGKPQNINYRKGAPPTDEELATRGLRRKNVAGLGNFIAFDENTGEVDFKENSRLEDVQAENPNRLVIPTEDADSAATLRNSLANLISARAQREAARSTGSRDKPTQFDQEVDSTVQRLGLDPASKEDRNKAINVVKNAETARKSYNSRLTKQVGDQILLTSPDIAGAASVGQEFIEPMLAADFSPDQASKAAHAAFAWQIASRPPGQGDFEAIDVMTRNRLRQDFIDIVGLSPEDSTIRQAAEAANAQMEDGQIGKMDLYDKNKRRVGSATFIKLNGTVVPIASGK